MSNNKLNLTICSVSFQSAFYLNLNWELTSRLNDSIDPLKWIIVENTPDGANGKLNFKDDRFEIIPGVDMPQMIKHQGSYHHGAALNKSMNYVKTRFVLILDPDFFIVRKGWIEDVIRHMITNELAIFGVPWHPRWYRKYRYFPCIHCLFIDLDKLVPSSIDFMPDLINDPKQLVDNRWMKYLKFMIEKTEPQMRRNIFFVTLWKIFM